LEDIEPGLNRERAVVTEEIALPFDQTYTLALEDNFGDGMQRGYYLWANDPISGSGTGKFNYTQSHNFTSDETIFDGDGAFDGGESNSTDLPDIDIQLTRKGNDDDY
jgi:hypothetical protein